MRTYIVQPGDTLGQIALMFGTTVERLVELNGIVDPDRIIADQVLTVPGDREVNESVRVPAVGHVFPVEGYSGAVQLHHGSHMGASDLFADEGTPVLVMSGGTCTLSADESEDQFGGNNVLIRADDGLTYYYAHGDRPPTFGVGARVDTGDFIFGVGDTGNAKGTGHHLHIGIGHGIQDGLGAAGGAGINFNAVELLRNVLNGTTEVIRNPRRGISRRQYRVAGTGHLGLNMRAHPGTSAPIVAGLAEGTVVDGEDAVVAADGFRWRHIMGPADGFAADEFLTPISAPEPRNGGTRRGILSVDELYTLVRNHGASGDLDDIMVAAALTESGGNTEAVGDDGRSIGLWQMHDMGLGAGLSREQRADPDSACDLMLPHFQATLNESAGMGLTGSMLAVRTYMFTERPFGFPSLQSAAALRFLDRFNSLP